jgi:dTDP-4-dehydrorhamnose reductase
MKILVLGSTGQLGKCLNDQLLNTDHEVIFTSRQEIDIADFSATKNQIMDIAPDVVINATAYTAVDKAEEDQQTADLINHQAVKNIANTCGLVGCWLIHVSTDYVFDGASDVPYEEDGQTNPQGIYGETKLKGEWAIRSSYCKYIIIRTAWVFSEHGNNFLKTMLRLGSERTELSIVGDQIGCPTYAQDIAKAIVTIMPELNSQEGLTGIYNYCGDTACSWFEFAEEIFKHSAALGAFTIPALESVTTDKYPTLAKRPKFSVLNNSYIYEKFGISPSDWKLGIASSLKKLKTF